MSLKNKELIEKNQYELTFEVERSVFDAAVEKVYRRQAKNITIPGFRRGKAPRSIIEKMYGKGVFYEDAVNEVLPDAYEAAAKESGLDIVGRPEFDMEPIEDGNITLKARYTSSPRSRSKATRASPQSAPLNLSPMRKSMRRSTESVRETPA